jgi:hypothetical protein
MTRLIPMGEELLLSPEVRINDKGYAGAEDKVGPETDTSDGQQVDPSYKLVT